MANLPRAGVEYFTWDFTGLPEGVTAEFQIGDTWHTLTVDGQEGKALLRGPDAPEVADSILIAESVDKVRVRVTGSPEIIYRGQGSIKLITV